MTFLTRVNLLAAVLILGQSALSRGDVPEPAKSAPTTDVSVEHGIACLHLRLDSANKVELIDASITAGVWSDNRPAPIGPRLFFAVLDSSGSVLFSGYRKDPRDMNSSGRRADLLLSVPYTMDVATVELYSVGYESGGANEYSRNFKLLGSFDIGPKVLATVE
ncbi:MAG: hypothetical protein WC360_03125 [Opitutales bacterium]|jgi:hypothetical protein